MLAEDLLGAGDEPVELTVRRRTELDKQRRRGRRELEPVLGAPAMFWAATISAGATISSTAVAPDSTRAGTGSVADSIPSKWSQETVVFEGFGTVSKTASAMKARVPSEPTSRRRKISTGVSPSRKAQSR